MLALVHDAVRQADNKGAVTLGAAGVIGGALYHLVASRPHPGAALEVAACVCGALVVAAATCAGLCLLPRLRPRDEPNSLVYFHHILRRHRGVTSGPGYEGTLTALTTDTDRLLADLGAQIWANTQIADRKYQMSRLGLIAIMLAVLVFTAASVIAITSA